MTWWRYKSNNEQDHDAVCKAIYTNQKSLLLAELPIELIKKEIKAQLPIDWKFTDDCQHESTLEGSSSGAIQISWSDQSIIASMYGDFVGGAKAMDEVLTNLKIPRYDPQTGEREGTD